jgi:hypothetical protein
VSGEFVPGLALAKGFYADVVAPLVSETRHSAALLGWGSDVLGFDTPRSTDHGWGPRLQVFVDEADVGAVDELLETHLPDLYRGWPVRFGWDEHPVVKRVEVTSLDAWLEQQVGFDPRPAPSPPEWLTMPQQSLLEIVSGDVFHDGLGELEPLRATLEWYPRDVWLWLLAVQWRRLDQEEAFVGRAAEVGDDLGSGMIAARLVRDLVRMCFLQERRYAPYSKWLGSAFRRLDAHAALHDALAAALAAERFPAREAALVHAFEGVARRHNALGLTDELDVSVRGFHGRPFRVLASQRFADACYERVSDPWLRSLPPVGSVDQLVDTTDVLSYPQRARRIEAFYEPE